MTAQRFGTGATPTEVVKTEGPGVARTFVNGMALAAGWFAVVGVIKLVQKSLADSPENESMDEEGFYPSDYDAARGVKQSKAQARRVQQLLDAEDDD